VATSVIPGAGYVHVDNQKTGEEHPYAWDIVSHIIHTSTGRSIPDLLPAHSAREMFAQYHYSYIETYQALVFADMVSSQSQTYPIWIDLAEHDEERRNAATTYIEGNVEESIRVMVDILDRVRKAREKAELVLSTSLFFIYITEYSLVGGTILISLYATLSLIHYHRIRQVGATRYVRGYR
jgi:hypothetical protein